MVSFPVRTEKLKELQEKMRLLGIREEDLEERFARSSGRGGQKLHKTSNSVFLHHKPTGIIVRCRKERSQALNRFLARRRMVEKIEEQLGKKAVQGQRNREKVRKKKDRSRRRATKKMISKKTTSC